MLTYSFYVNKLAACLGSECISTGHWHCPHCTDRFSYSGRVGGESRSSTFRLNRVVKAPEYQPGGCVVCRFVSEIAVSKPVSH